MLIQSTASPTDARKNFFSLLEQVANDHQVVVVKRREGENVALIAESDLSSLYETAYLLKSPKMLSVFSRLWNVLRPGMRCLLKPFLLIAQLLS